YRQLLARTPLARHAGPEAVVLGVRYLLGARFVTGEILHVDGGRRLD
ncbi:MAG: pteridine reductase, partial [Magnetococcales bacterium]|nr:pteridine reductase [Magnetococcales bacterium]